jgi:hypothetical protein
MTTLTAPSLTEAQQALIDARLDTIDRMLSGRVPRADRMAIVREVESQIQELLAERESEVSRDDIIEVLRRLDPPEAYLPEDEEAVEFLRQRRSPSVPATQTAPGKSASGREGRLGGILGLCSLGIIFLMPLFYIFAINVNSEAFGTLFLGGPLLLAIAGSITSLVLSVRGRRQGVMPLIGIITASITLPVSLLGMAFLLWLPLAS